MSQTSISGVINDYAKVVSIDGTDRVTLSDASSFSPGDTVLIIQMKGVGINVNNNAGQYGSLQNKNDVGNYELLIIFSKAGNQVVFTADLSKTYDAGASVQLVRVRGYTNAVVTGELTCQPWDSTSGTGGVLVLLVDNTLTLNAGINVSGLGFRGGTPVNGKGECSVTDPAYTNMSFGYLSDSAGFKGEGLASYAISVGNYLEPGYMQGAGPQFNGGGGGNARYSGGGGGGNYGAGGAGGAEADDCGTPGSVGGLSGKPITTIPAWNSENRIFMGGGGGSGTQSGGTIATAGGNGGGIVLIMADTLVGNGYAIHANGESVTSLADGGAGGGGAGGTVLLDIGELKTGVLIEATGGNGGQTNGAVCTGPGGGGGGGIIKHSNPVSWGNATVDVSGGTKGTSLNGSCITYFGSDGDSGTVMSNVSIPLTGFLFNSIFSAQSGDIADTICEGEVVPKLMGSLPKGGTSPYNYTWESSNDKITWNVEASGPIERVLNLMVQLFDTTYYRRTITDSSVPVITDVSKIITIVVQPKIGQNELSFDTTICFGQTPNPIIPVFGMPSGGDGVYTYLWEESTDGVNFADAQGVNNTSIYQPPALTTTTYYRRNVYSGKCQNISDTVTITVLPLIGNNAVSADQTICEGELFLPLAGSSPTGGDGSYLYQWIESPDSVGWNNAYGTGSNPGYNPDTTSATFPGKTYFRRVVYSGMANTCADTSNAVILIDWPKITNNLISADQQICEGEIPAALAGTPPAGGDGSYTFLWEQSNDNSTFAAGTETNTNQNYNPASLLDTTYYRRIVASDVCRDTSLVLTITVDPLLQNYGVNLPSGITDTTICDNQSPATIIPESTPLTGGDGIYTFIWQESTDGGSSWLATGGNTPALSPGTLNQSTLFRRQVISGACTAISDTVSITVLPLISGNSLPADFSICSGDSTLINGSLPSGGDGSYLYFWEQSTDAVVWNTATGNNAVEDYQTIPLTNPVYFRRIVQSGPASTCVDTSTSLAISILPLPTATISFLDTAICDGNSVDLMVQVTGVSGPWSLNYDDGFGSVSTAGITTTSPQAITVSPAASGAFTDYLYTLVDLTDNAGCKALPGGLTGQAKVHVDGMPVSDPGTDDEVCGFSYTLGAATPPFGVSAWNVPPGMVLTDSSLATATATVSAEGTYPLTWEVSNGVCPVVSSMVNITFWEDPGMVHAGNDTILEPGNFSIILNGTQDPPVVGSILWTTTGNSTITNPSLLSTEVTAMDPGENIFTLSASNGICPVKTDNIKVTVQTFVKHNYGISPNGDGINDFFRVTGAGFVENALTIIDEHGVVVYSVDNFMHAGTESEAGWYGTFNDLEPVPEGTYFYILELRGKISERLTGYIVVKRQ